MLGGGNRKDDLVISHNNVFAALGSLRKKKKSDKDSKSKNSSDSSSSKMKQNLEPQVFWAPAPLASRSWADVDDEDDDDYFATTAPSPGIWDADDSEHLPPQSKESRSLLEETGSEEDDDLEEADDDNAEEPEPKPKPEPVVPIVDPAIEKPSDVVTPKEPERQLSKKEIKKKELAELDAMLAKFGCTKIEDEDTSRGVIAHDKKADNTNEVDKTDGVAVESKSGKKKKKKDKSLKEVNAEVGNGSDEKNGMEDGDDVSSVDVKEKLKKMASTKKKKSSKEMDAAAKAAASEATARAAKLAAAKKKEKIHYNQQPVR